MKRKTLKLFLILGVITLSLLGFASCKDTPPENTNFKAIENDELLEFVLSTALNSDFGHETPSSYHIDDLAWLYRIKDINDVFEFEVSKKSQLICAYIAPTTLSKIVNKDNLSFDNSYKFDNLLNKYIVALNNKQIDFQEDKLYLFAVSDKNIPFIYNENTLVFVCELYTLNFNDGSFSTVVLKHSGKIYFPESEFEQAYFKPDQKIESISSFPYKSQKGIISKSFLTKFMWSTSLLETALKIENIDGIPYLRYSPGLCDEAFNDAIKEFKKVSLSDGDCIENYISYFNIKELLEIK